MHYFRRQFSNPELDGSGKRMKESDHSKVVKQAKDERIYLNTVWKFTETFYKNNWNSE